MKDFQNINIKSLWLCVILVFIPFKHQALEPLPYCPMHQHSEFAPECDLCGCSTSSGSFGFGSLKNSNFVGVRYIYQSFESKDGIFENSPTSKESFNTYQVWGRVPITENFYVSSIIPYQDLYRDFTHRTEHINGIGDMNVIGWYQLTFYKKQKAGDVVFSTEREPSGHRIQFGLGVKLPTGEFEESLTDYVNPGFQVGTGSWDGIFALNYGYSAGKIGINTTATYYAKTANKNDYRFGNQFSYASNFYYSIPKTTFIAMPFVGVSGDVYDSIEQFGEVIPETEGHSFSGTVGSEVVFNKFTVGANYTFPIQQNLFGDNVHAKNKFSLYLNLTL
ncbi:hypothetical protein [Pseudotamlana agarivorans]|uniref:hypothetical protein n=1 Tax=Pseudotamlana agarivorans TaxID=481183 RepID=UPI0012F8FED9|nr:hypothetical protein [Tamlana agarivorans]